MPRVEHIGLATLYLGDCREIMPTLGRRRIEQAQRQGDLLRDVAGAAS